ncbi:uncharacterized protein [Battus philenor]|uniref:uncharacterized protein n=1 Tax=Battus philenor TaxID=42288 RepID=UPI0035D0BA94
MAQKYPEEYKADANDRLTRFLSDSSQSLDTLERKAAPKSSSALNPGLSGDSSDFTTVSEYLGTHDIVLVFLGQKAQDISSRANAVLAHVHEWGVKNKLRFAPHKTKVMVFTNKLKYDYPLLNMGGEPLGRTGEIRILGLTVDDRLTFNTHVKNVSKKAQGLYRQLCRAAKVSWGRAAGGSAQAYAIMSDSRSALETVARSDTLHPLAFRVKENVMKVREKGKDVRLYWVKAHAGTEGNEKADQLAKDVALKSKRRPEYERCPISFVKRQLRLESLDEWNRRYMEGTTVSVTRTFFPDAISAYRVLRSIEVDAVSA